MINRFVSKSLCWLNNNTNNTIQYLNSRSVFVETNTIKMRTNIVKLVLAIASGLMITSCQKTYTCTCASNDGSISTYMAGTVTANSKSKANAACSQKSDVQSINCSAIN